MRSARMMLAGALMLVGTTAWSADVSVFAAASLKSALEEIAAIWQAETGQGTTLTFAASSSLARQVDQGAPADLILLANEAWMDWLVDRDRIQSDSRVSLVGNTLVLIGADPSAPPLALTQNAPIAHRLGDNHLAMALVDAVPVGIYGKAALTSLGVWDGIAPRVAQTDNARTALALVATGEAPLGVVYGSDAIAEPRVTVLGTFPAESHPPIQYPAALNAESTHPCAGVFLDFLASPTASGIFAQHGFDPRD